MGRHVALLHLSLTIIFISTVQGCWNATAEAQKQTLSIPSNATINRTNICWWIHVHGRLSNHRIEIQIASSFKCGSRDILQIQNEDLTSEISCSAAQRSPTISDHPSMFVKFQRFPNDGEMIKDFLIIQAVSKSGSAVCETAKYSADLSQNHYLQSPGYPANYHPNLNLCWILEAKSGEKIFLEVSDFSLEDSASSYCTNDFVEIRDGGDASAPLMYRWCERSQTKTLKSSGNYIFVRFKTDRSGAKRGFKFIFYQEKKDADAVTPSITMAAIAFGTMVICAILIYRRTMCFRRQMRHQQQAMSSINVHMSPVQNVTISNSTGTSVYATPMPSPPPYSAVVGVDNPAVVDTEDKPPSYESLQESTNR